MPVKASQRAHVHYDGVNFSHQSTHAGDSTIIYHPTPKSKPVGSQIEFIEESVGPNGPLLCLHVCRNLPLPWTIYDPFSCYPHFHATTCLSEMSSALDIISSEDVVPHAAWFDYSCQRSVYLILSRDWHAVGNQHLRVLSIGADFNSKIVALVSWCWGLACSKTPPLPRTLADVGVLYHWAWYAGYSGHYHAVLYLLRYTSRCGRYRTPLFTMNIDLYR